MVTVDHKALADVCSRYGIARLWVFGSTARGEAQPDNDVDLLYEVAPGSRLGWEIVNLIGELAVIFGRPVDLIARRSVHPLIREAVLSEAKEIHAA
jgi:predicted nucleotidyltransferase